MISLFISNRHLENTTGYVKIGKSQILLRRNNPGIYVYLDNGYKWRLTIQRSYKIAPSYKFHLFIQQMLMS